MPFYENIFIARQDLSQAQAESLAQKFAEVLQSKGGKVTKTEYWGLRSLAYRMKKNRKGHYHLMNIEADPLAIAEMERVMKLNEDVLRILSVRVDRLEDGPSIQMRYRPEREDGFSGDQRFGDREWRPRDGYRARAESSSELDEGQEEILPIAEIPE